MKYQANPVIVEAVTIVSVGPKDFVGDTPLALSDGRNIVADVGQTARYHPEVGDYVVTQADGYTYLNPKAVFEHKYSPLPVSAEKAA